MLLEGFDYAMTTDKESALEFLVCLNVDAVESNMFNILVECTEPSNAECILNKFRNSPSTGYILLKEKRSNCNTSFNSIAYNSSDRNSRDNFEDKLKGFNRYACRCHSHTC